MPGGLHRPHDIQLPLLLAARCISQALEGNLDLHLVAVVGHVALGLPDVVGRKVGRFASAHEATGEAATLHRTRFDQHAVALDAERIHGEQHRLTTVVVGAEEELDVVVGRDLVAVGQVVSHRARRRIGPDTHMQRGGRVEHEHLGAVTRRHAVGWEVLREPREQRSLAPDRLVQHAIDLDRRRVARGRDGERPAAAVIHGACVRLAW